MEKVGTCAERPKVAARNRSRRRLMDRIVATVRRIIRSSAYAPLLRECAGFLASCGESEVLVLAASRGAADDLVRSSCEVGFAGVHRTTLTGLAAELAALDLAERDLAPMRQISPHAMAAPVLPNPPH